MTTASLVYVAWFLAVQKIGHSPQPLVDDPKSISTGITILHDLAIPLVTLCVFVLPVAVPALLLSVFALPSKDRPRALVLAGASSVISFVVWTLFQLDPCRVLYWLFD